MDVGKLDNKAKKKKKGQFLSLLFYSYVVCSSIIIAYVFKKLLIFISLADSTNEITHLILGTRKQLILMISYITFKFKQKVQLLIFV
jgi:hypothetical protein